MRTKKLLIALSLLALVQPMFADGGARPRRRTRPAGMSRPSGGIVERAYGGAVLRIRNAQGRVPSALVHALAGRMRLAALLPFEAVEGPAPAGDPLRAAAALAAERGVGAGVLVVDDPGLPWMLVAPEARWTILNVAPLAADAPSAERLAVRFEKVLWCAVARTLGAGYSSYPGCVLTPFSTVAELDAIPVTRPCPEPFNKMIDTGARYGIGTISIATYRTACERGWAPAPTNDVQRAIWREVRADVERGPTKPITIPPPGK